MELVWQGEPDGVLTAGFGRVTYVGSDPGGAMAPPVPGVLPPAVAGVWASRAAHPRTGRWTWLVAPRDPVDPRFDWKPQEPDHHHYALEAVDPATGRLFFHDAYQEATPCVVVLDPLAGQLALHKRIPTHHHFERTLAFAPGGTIVATSGMGVEVFPDDGDPEPTVDLRTGQEGRAIAADRASYVYAPAYGLHALERWTLGGDLVWRVEGVAIDGQLRRFGWHEPGTFGATGLWLDGRGRTWVAGEPGVVVLGPTGELEGHFPRVLFGPGVDVEHLIGVDDHGVAWFGAGPRYWGYLLEVGGGTWLAPGMAERGDVRTGLEPLRPTVRPGRAAQEGPSE